MKRAFDTLISLKNAKKGVSVVLLAVLMLLQSMVAAPGLHQLFHVDAASPSHHCAVTMLASGHVACADPVVAVAPPAFVFIQADVPSVSDFVSTDVLLHPSRGPPQSSVLLG